MKKSLGLYPAPLKILDVSSKNQCCAINIYCTELMTLSMTLLFYDVTIHND